MDRKKFLFTDWMSSILFAISMVIVSYNLLFDFNPMLMVLCTALSIFAVLINMGKLSKVHSVKLTKLIVVIIGLWLWCVFLAFLQNSLKPTRFVVLEMLMYTGMISFLLCNTKMPLLPLKVAMYAILAFYYYQYFILGIISYGINEEGSGAVNTLILLSVAITIQVLDYRDNQQIALLPSILIIPIAIMSWNRTGFVMSIFYMLTVFFIGTSLVRKRTYRVSLYLFFAISCVFVVVKCYDWFVESALYSKIAESGFDNTSRSTIWAEYFKTFDIVQLFFGRAIDERHLLAGFFNAHNSFIMLHAQTGFIALLLIGTTIKRLWQYFKYNKFIFCLFMALIVRSFFDMIFFFHPFDYAFYLFVFNSDSLIKKSDKLSVKVI